MELPRQEYWSGLPFPSPGDRPHPGIETWSLALQADSLPSELPGKPLGTLLIPSNYAYITLTILLSISYTSVFTSILLKERSCHIVFFAAKIACLAE